MVQRYSRTYTSEQAVQAHANFSPVGQLGAAGAPVAADDGDPSPGASAREIDVQSLLGHSSLAMVQRYARTYSSEQAVAAPTVTRWRRAICRPAPGRDSARIHVHRRGVSAAPSVVNAQRYRIRADAGKRDAANDLPRRGAWVAAADVPAVRQLVPVWVG